jgi:hypothetical protein
MNSRMAWDRLVPPERAGDVARREPLAVEPLRRLLVDELVIEDDDLPQADGATLFWLGHRDAGWEAWAARIEGADATPWLVSAQRLEIIRPDPALLALIGLGEGESEPTVTVSGAPRGVEPVPRQLACICRERSLEAVYRAAEEGWRTVDAVKRRTGAIFGECQGRRCRARIAARLDLALDEPRAQITPRPPLVPVPASILAAFAGL